MRTFQDLINQGIAPSRYEQPIAKCMPEDDPFVRAYNNVWGIVSDTHMNKIDDDNYFITGSMIRDQRKFSQFLFAEYWGGYKFANTAAAKVNDAWSLSGFLGQNRLVGSFGVINGDQVYLLTNYEGEEVGGCPEFKNCGIPCTCKCICCREGFEESLNGSTMYEILDMLNEDKHVDGSRWQVATTNEGLTFVNENDKKIILK